MHMIIYNCQKTYFENKHFINIRVAILFFEPNYFLPELTLTFKLVDPRHSAKRIEDSLYYGIEERQCNYYHDSDEKVVKSNIIVL